jgi:hypothetical protein
MVPSHLNAFTMPLLGIHTDAGSDRHHMACHFAYYSISNHDCYIGLAQEDTP